MWSDIESGCSADSDVWYGDSTDLVRLCRHAYIRSIVVLVAEKKIP